MTVTALKKNNMNRKAKGTGFQMKGHTLPGVKQLKSTTGGRANSSAFQKDKKVYAIEDYQAGMNQVDKAIKGGATKEEVRKIVQAHNKANIGKKYKKGAQANSLIAFDKIKFGDNNKKQVEQTSTPTSEAKQTARGSVISGADQKRITDKYGLGVDNTGNRAKEYQIAAENFANRNKGY